MRIIHIGTGVVTVPSSDSSAGVEEYVFELADKQARLGHLVEVIDLIGSEAVEDRRRRSSAHFIEFNLNSRLARMRMSIPSPLVKYAIGRFQTLVFSVFASLYLFGLLRRQVVDIIHAHDGTVALSAVFVSRLMGGRTKVVLTIHSSIFSKYDSATAEKLLYASEYLALKNADYIFAVSETARNVAVKYGANPARTSCIVGGVSLGGPNPSSNRRKQVLTHGFALCTGTISHRKNQLTAIKATADIIAELPDFVLVLAGRIADARYYNEISSYISVRHLTRNVKLVGNVSKEKLIELYQTATMFVFPTLSDISPASLKEALYFGLPIVASNIPGVSDLFSLEPGAAILANPEDESGFARAMQRIWADRDLRETMSLKSGSLGRQLSYENVAAQTIVCYRRLLRGSQLQFVGQVIG